MCYNNWRPDWQYGQYGFPSGNSRYCRKKKSNGPIKTYQVMGCCSVGAGGPTGIQAVWGGCCDTVEESQRLETAAGFPARCGPQELWGRTVGQSVCLSGASGLNWQTVRLHLHFPCFLFSSISILRSLRFSSLTFFCLRRLLFSNSSAGKNVDHQSVAVFP